MSTSSVALDSVMMCKQYQVARKLKPGQLPVPVSMTVSFPTRTVCQVNLPTSPFHATTPGAEGGNCSGFLGDGLWQHEPGRKSRITPIGNRLDVYHSHSLPASCKV